MTKVLEVIDKISDRSGVVSSVLIYPGLLVLLYEIVSRYFFHAPTIWAHGTSQRIFAAYFIIGGAYALVHEAHIRMDIFYSRFSLKTRALINLLLTYPLLFITAFVLLWHGSDYASEAIKLLERCATPFRAPVWPIKLLIPLSGLLLLFQGLALFYRDITVAITGVKRI